ncbi:UDP-N-acetylmuramoylalanyl-D-glutamate--2,6-diaminopimelate ligase [Mesobacillus persicus]|uniref:UDP-N-acetylmuramoylalanyl-D-glutamate--2,6-diaminopimelate ligase n=1 Tax=Mesobacillus persicus TaxID=930146 RepID=A0A1H8FPY7_9BACI|nr:UDP-N-acetylmuramoyl-L-alanyl-D-glutamate--2,6-diaminopimelate ligase [Mesobacillus persicus]SEN33762.1 UDP-N-acetylmuramoylalanyl-D-glutamate--2,6-diaminopimelate ligase [Mesobacillus persicus]
MKLSKLLNCLNEYTVGTSQYSDVNITGIQMDSRKVVKGDLFVAISGFESDGHKFIEQAIVNGASAVVGEQSLSLKVPYFIVNNSRLALGRLASMFFDFPSKRKKVIGITGTNGKTTVSYMLKHILESNGFSTALFGTVSYTVNNQVYESTNTTPNPIQLQELLAKSLDEFAILEVSSHALTQARIEGLEIDYGLFTNLSHEHLDYHGNMQAYFKAKASMYNFLKPDGKALVSEFDFWGDKLSNVLGRKEIPVRTLGCSGNHKLIIEKINLNGETEFTVAIAENNYNINLPCPGLHNVYNAALAFLTAYEIGINPKQIVKALESFPGVPGRFEVVQHPRGAKFIIDYAHTKDAFEFCLQTAKEHKAKKITHIYGFRGGRDKMKRENMIKASSSMCDHFILTLDDLNGIEKEEMLNELSKLNLQFGQNKGKVIADRTIAIQTAWKKAQAGEWIFITGKGPEEYETEFTLPVSSDKEVLTYLQEGISEHFA